MVASFRKKVSSSSLPPYVHMVKRKGGCTFATMKCLLLVVIWQFFLCGFNFSCSWRHCTTKCIQFSQIRVWSARNDATSNNWVLPIIKCLPVLSVWEYGEIKWRTHLVSYDCQVVCTKVMHVDLYFADSLSCVCMQKYPGLGLTGSVYLCHSFKDFFDWLKRKEHFMKDASLR